MSITIIKKNEKFFFQGVMGGDKETNSGCPITNKTTFPVLYIVHLSKLLHYIVKITIFAIGIIIDFFIRLHIDKLLLVC